MYQHISTTSASKMFEVIYMNSNACIMIKLNV